MFVLFSSETFQPFFTICSSFPTVIFSFLLIISLFYGLLTIFGLFDLDALDIDLPEADVDVNSLGAIAGLMLKLGLNGVPFMIIFMLVSLFGWMFSFVFSYFLFPIVPGFILELALSLVILLGSLWLAVLLTARAIRPLRKFFKVLNQSAQKNIIGQRAIVRTGRVDQSFGEATVDDGGAGLIVRVRAFKEEQFSRGEEVVLVEYSETDNIYRVISKNDFEGKLD